KKRRRKTPPEPTCEGSMGKNKKKAKTTDSVKKENQETPIQKTPLHNISSQSKNDKACQKDENTEEEHVPTRISNEIAKVNKETSKQRHVLNNDYAENMDILLEKSAAQPHIKKPESTESPTPTPIEGGFEDSKRILSPDIETESTEIQEVSKVVMKEKVKTHEKKQTPEPTKEIETPEPTKKTETREKDNIPPDIIVPRDEITILGYDSHSSNPNTSDKERPHADLLSNPAATMNHIVEDNFIPVSYRKTNS
ncbi:9127_t:CDS:2, partial [Dentiscutata heterogama]